MIIENICVTVRECNNEQYVIYGAFTDVQLSATKITSTFHHPGAKASGFLLLRAADRAHQVGKKRTQTQPPCRKTGELIQATNHLSMEPKFPALQLLPAQRQVATSGSVRVKHTRMQEVATTPREVQRPGQYYIHKTKDPGSPSVSYSLLCDDIGRVTKKQLILDSGGNCPLSMTQKDIKSFH